MLWFLLYGILLGAVGFYLASHDELKLEWYDWALLVVGAFLLMWGVHDLFASFRELSPAAGWFILLSAGIPGLIMVGIVAFRLYRQLDDEPAKPAAAATE